MSANFPRSGRARGRVRHGALIGLMLLAAASAPAAAQSAAAESTGLGRVFFTPEQRQELDRRRQFNIREAVVTQANTFTLSGQVSRSSGKTTTWINSVPQHDAYRPSDPATAPVATGEYDPGVPLKVGQTLEKTSGNVTDGLAGGQVKVNRGARKKQ